MGRIRDRMTYANVMATAALFVALGGTAAASVIITSNGQVAKNTISGHAPPSGDHPNIVGNSITGADIKEATLGTVPRAANSADLGGSPASAYLRAPVGPSSFGTIPAVRATNSMNESIPNASYTTLTFDTNAYDNAGMHSTSTNTSRLTAPISGVYDVTGSVVWAGSTTGDRFLYIRKNGSSDVAFSAVAIAAGYTSEEATTQVRLSAGDYLELQVYQGNGTALNIENFGDYSPQFAMHWVGP